MSSTDESDDQFESADEDIDFEPKSQKSSVLKIEAKNVAVTDDIAKENKSTDQLVFEFADQLKIKTSEEKSSQPIVLEHKIEEQELKNTSPLISEEAINQKQKEENEIISEKMDTKIGSIDKPFIKGRRILRKVDRIKEQTTDQTQSQTDILNINETIKTEDKIIKEKPIDTNDNIDTKETIETKKTDKLSEVITTGLESTESEPSEEKQNISEDIKISEVISQPNEHKNDLKASDKLYKEETVPSSEVESQQNTVKSLKVMTEAKVEEYKEREEKTLIKGRKLLRKADRVREQTTNEESISEEKKIEVLNKLSNLTEKEDTSGKWNNWFSDITTAAKSATSMTANHVSQASNKWSFDPKSLLSSAVSITSQVGSGLTSVVENVSSAVDSAIGAPPPEQMAALVTKDSKVEETLESEPKVGSESAENQSKSGFGFGLFDYTLNTLESIGKKTMEVIVDDKQKFRPNEDRRKTDKMD